MRISKLLIILILFILFVPFSQLNAQPLSIHPENSHYFEYKGKPTLLISSAEHYGALINRAFNYRKYLETLHKDGMNYTRIFVGSYVEIPNSFGIENNTLAPSVGNFLAPWKKVNETGLYEGEKKFDLSQWNPDYFKRLNDFISLANKLDIIVEVTFFCSTYQDAYWERNPFNKKNNVNNFPDIDRKDVNTLRNGKILHYQKELVKKIVTELNEFDNVIYEIQNEPWSDQPREGMLFLRILVPGGKKNDGRFKLATAASYKWQIKMAHYIVETEKDLPQKHLIAQNYCNRYYPLKDVDPAISILNFHYAWPEASFLNYGWERPVSFDESGFSENSGMGDTAYLRQAWEFILAGGAIFNNLDYSFFCGSEDGMQKNKAPGGGSKELRRQLHFLRVFMQSFDFIKMKPDFEVVYHAPGMRAQALSEKGEQYAIVFTEMTNNWVKLNLPKGKYQYTFFSPFTGDKLKKGIFKSVGNTTHWEMPEGVNYMVTLKIIKQ